jgi:hypothetical protein
MGGEASPSSFNLHLWPPLHSTTPLSLTPAAAAALLPAPQGEVLVYKPGKGAFYATDLQEQLQARGITHLIFAGVTTEVRLPAPPACLPRLPACPACLSLQAMCVCVCVL